MLSEKNMSVAGLMEFFFKEFLIEAKNMNLNTLDRKIEKYFKANDFKIREFVQVDKFPVPIFGGETNVEKLMDFVLTLPEKIHENNSDKINGVLIFVDEFQIINELDDYKESFLWKLRAYIQNQNYVSYVFSGLMGMQDELISEIASQGCFWRKDAYNQHISIHQRNRKIIFNAKGSKSEIHRWGI